MGRRVRDRNREKVYAIESLRILSTVSVYQAKYYKFTLVLYNNQVSTIHFQMRKKYIPCRNYYTKNSNYLKKKYLITWYRIYVFNNSGLFFYLLLLISSLWIQTLYKLLLRSHTVIQYANFCKECLLKLLKIISNKIIL